ncbi:MAG: TauD/TfdA family dioxygenase [Chitinophagaceae bacterium]|nr:TauD/TfdA family dioxygenase [Chitinophagaceae bacterium]
MQNKISIEQLIQNDQELSIISSNDQSHNTLNVLVAYLQENNALLKELLLKNGAILFRGFEVNDNDDFRRVKEVFFGTSDFTYMDGNSPRTKLSSNIYTSTEYPQELAITLHNELSYSSNWPKHLLFYCHIAAEEGGETPLCNSRQILKKLDVKIVDAFAQYGVKYTRFLSGSQGMGKTWANTFETSDQNVIEQYCHENNIEFFWENGGLYLSNNGPGIIDHPITGEAVWFNQANQFHPCSLSNDVYKGMKLLFSDQKYKYPQYAYYGNGEEIPEAYLKEITEVHFSNSLKFKWQKGDIVILDNLLVAHGRMPFKGPRKIYVSMC